MSKEYIDSHLSHFQDGVTKIKSKAPVDTEGVGLGTFVMPKSVADDVIAQAGAWPGYWTPGGYTKPGGVMETVIDPVPKTEYIVTEDILGK